MKQYFIWIMAICVYFTCVPQPASAGVQVEHLVGAWLFDDGEGDIATDTSRNGHDGEIIGPAWVDEGRFGSALEFYGGEDMVMVEHSDDLNLQTFTIMAQICAEGKITNFTNGRITQIIRDIRPFVKFVIGILSLRGYAWVESSKLFWDIR